MHKRGWIIVAVVVAVLALGGPLWAGAADTSKPEQQTPALDLASTASSQFLTKYVSADGQVKVDGSETQAQAQAWALLIAAASGDSAHFTKLLAWSNTNIPTSAQTKETTLDTAWALETASKRLGNSSYLGTANALAVNVATAPSASTANQVDNGVFFLGAAQLEQGNATTALRALVDNQRSDLSTQMGNPTLSKLPVSAKTNNYSDDALNQPLNLATSCNANDTQTATFIWTKLRDSRDSRTAASLTAAGKVVDSTQNVRATIASAAAAKAAGQELQSTNLLLDADGIVAKNASAQNGAWDALGRILLTTPWLGSCS